ncbi:hypothetical protein AB0I84_13295 [Streptomyces spectabilis]|uniref:hypothetical protein n=1 Tax=Streptomyces spectabilis TaxID=68270 RepID=UPI0033F365EE
MADTPGEPSAALRARGLRGPECPLRAEAVRLRDEATLRVRLADRRALWWAVVDVVLGFPAALLAGISGAAGLATADARVPAAFLALFSAGLAAGAGFLRSDTRRVANKRARKAWAAVQDEAAIALAHDRVDDDAMRVLCEKRQAALSAYEGDDGPR